MRELELVQTEILLRQKAIQGTSPFARYLRQFTNDELMAALIRVRSIYGEDNRIDPSDKWFLPSAVRQNVRRTAAIMDRRVFEPPRWSDKVVEYRFRDPKTVEQNGICCDERFSRQISAATCTAFLISPNEVATARHCVPTDEDLIGVYFVFEFAKDFFGRVPMSYTYGKNLFKAGKVVRSCPGDEPDWAIVTLDHAVPDHNGVTLGDGLPALNTSLYSIGHSFGTPVKYIPGAIVRQNNASQFFVANLDGFKGSSGSPVFDANHAVQGIWVRGEETLVPTNCKCDRPLICSDDGCGGEEIWRISLLPKDRKEPNCETVN